MAAPASHAAIVPGATVDGPSADIDPNQHVDMDVAPDGTAAIGYLKQDGGEAHVFVSRFVNGAWTPGERVDDGLEDQPSRRVSVAVANGGKVAVSFVNAPALNPYGQLHILIKPDAASPFQDPAPETQPYSVSGYYADLDLAPGGDGYAAVSIFGQPQQDLRSLRISGSALTLLGGDFGNDAGDLDNDPNNKNAGIDELQRAAHIAATPDGSGAVVVWTEEGENIGDYDLWARRLVGTAIGPQQMVNVPTFMGDNEVKFANDMSGVDTDGTGAAWISFRESFDTPGNRGRALARKMVGDVLEGPQLLDALPPDPPEAAEFPQIDINEAGQGIAANTRQLDPFETDGSALVDGTWGPAFQAHVDPSESPSVPGVALAESGAGLIAWRDDPVDADQTAIRARVRASGALAEQLTLSQPGGGDASGLTLEAGADAGNFAAVAFTQGTGADAKLVAAVVDLPQPPGGTDGERPEVSAVRLSRKRFRIGRKAPALLAAVKVGTTIRFNLSEAARTTFSFERLSKGRRVGGKCRKQTRANRGKRRCTRSVRVKRTFGVEGRQGQNRVRFQGRITKRRALKPGRYRMTLRARDAAGNDSSPDRATFRLLKAKRKKKK